ncbi:glycosyl hydrolase-related protein [Paenibacillus sp. J5C_2022]|uniref:alpha-mannosidase n=1 Tax=Paenibacillus sp. J5C2022 TaxID=2977129 RepID=UPI0021CF871C|nr:glycoside hydrolase family 38 C-terminal domain-containing protein [Paenibacillus sp. J5C2022]MCU6708062.1 glycosyl hydrolase-related protein [Paenibacillus sp. J5C2022]
MPYETEQVIQEKVKRVKERLGLAIYRLIEPLSVQAWVTEEPVAYNERMTGRHMQLRPGDRWGNLWDCAWFRFEGTVPVEASGCKTVLLLDVNGELCLMDETGTPCQGLTNINSEFDYTLGLPGKRVVDVSSCAAGGERIDIWADAGCNDLFGHYRSGTLKEASIAVCDENVRQLYYDFEVLAELAAELPEQSSRRSRIWRKLYEASRLLSEISPVSVESASELLAVELARRSGDEELRISAIGHAHIDLAWLWPIRETIRKGARTFSTVLRNMEKYPDYIFGASQPQLYAWIKEYYPGLYEKVKKRVAEGRWEIQGAMWVEPDTNVSGGEALARQILYGKQFFREEFGVDVETLWMPDVFGYSGSLPQLLALGGVKYMMTQKLSWNVYNQHPHHSFIWEGIDGTGILTHLPPEDTYNGPAAPRSLAKIERRYLDKSVSDHALMLFGIGDGGGGPGEEHLERLSRLGNLSGLPPVKQEFSLDFFHRLETEASAFERYRGELYLEKHQGTLTSQARNKWYNRRMEIALRETEFAASLILALGGEDSYPAQRLKEIWKEILLYQFHDILPGSSIGRVYDESLARYAVLYEEVSQLQRSAYERAAELTGAAGPVVFNSLPWDRNEWVEWQGEWHWIEIPAMGAATLVQAPERSNAESLSAGEGRLENEYLRVTFGEDGSLVSVFSKLSGREALGSEGAGNLLSIYHDDGDAWDFPRDYRDAPAGTMVLEHVRYAVDGHRAYAEQQYSYGNSTLRQIISLSSGSKYVQFETESDWRETGKMLRTSFETSVTADVVSCEIQFGYLRRSTSRNTQLEMARDEICAHRYLDISEPGFGVALLNDCKYGHRAEGRTLDLNLLRSPSYPDPEADKAIHRFSYALLPHVGDHIQAGVARAGYEFNTPLVVVEGTLSVVGRQDSSGAGNSVESEIWSWLRVDQSGWMIEAVKKSENGDGIIVRLYESEGSASEGVLQIGFPCREVVLTDLMEENSLPLPFTGGQVRLSFRPFEIKTLGLLL